MYTCLLDKPFLVMVGLNQASRSPTISSLHTIHLSNHLQLYPHHVWCSTHDHPVQQSDYLSIHTYLSFILNHPVFSSLAMARSCYCCLVKMGKIIHHLLLHQTHVLRNEHRKILWNIWNIHVLSPELICEWWIDLSWIVLFQTHIRCGSPAMFVGL